MNNKFFCSISFNLFKIFLILLNDKVKLLFGLSIDSKIYFACLNK